MQYTIGEVAAITNLSRDMIRYYEKHGAIRASRNPENNYRYYDEMQVFWLLEATQHKSWGVPIDAIKDIRTDEYTRKTSEFLKKRISEIQDQTTYLTVLRERLMQLKEYLEFGSINIGNFWIKEMPATYRCHFVRAHDDDYEKIDISLRESEIVFSDKLAPFFDSAFTTKGNTIDWEMSINAHYCEQLKVKLGEDFTFVPSSLALTTHIDIGEIGEFDLRSFNTIRNYALEHNYKVIKDTAIRGYLLGRGYEKEHFRRIVRIFLPIESS